MTQSLRMAQGYAARALLPPRFNLTRTDIINYIRAMREDGSRFIITPSIKGREHIMAPDHLRCGEHSFALMVCRSGSESPGSVVGFILHMSSGTAERHAARHKVSSADFLLGSDWYFLFVDGSYESREDIYRILDDCYDYTLKRYYRGKKTQDVAC